MVSFPDSELLNGRLPWGCVRGIAETDHTEAGILAGNTLTIHPTLEARDGQPVILRFPSGETTIGVVVCVGKGGTAALHLRRRAKWNSGVATSQGSLGNVELVR